MMVVAIIQARLGSSRFPNKILEELGDGTTVIEQVRRRVERATLVDRIVIAMPVGSSADPRVFGINRVRLVDAPENDLLQRYYDVAVAERATTVVRITADCPFVDPGVIDEVVERLRVDSLDYVGASTVAVADQFPQRRITDDDVDGGYFPDGFDVEAFTLPALRKTHVNALSRPHREHVSPFMWTQPDVFRCGLVWSDWEARGFKPPYRLTLDTPADLAVLRGLYAAVGPDASYPSIVDWFLHHPNMIDHNKNGGTDFRLIL